MDTKKWIEKLDAQKRENLLNNPDQINLKILDNGKRQGIEFAEEGIEDMLEESQPLYIGGNFGDFFNFHETYYFYCILAEDSDAAQRELSLATAYKYLSLISAYNLKEIGNMAEDFTKLSYSFSFLLLAGWEEEAKDIFTKIMDDILLNDQEKMKFVSREGMGVWPISWFMIRMLAEYYNYEINDSYYPNLEDVNEVEWKFYQDTLENWESTDLNWVDKQVYLLCDLYVMENAKGEMPGEDFYEIRGMYLYPDPVLSWLKLRELKGLENPKEYTHELMNMPQTTIVRSLETPIPKPTELPYAKELLEMLKKTCSDLEVPQWVESLPETVPSKCTSGLFP